MRRFQGPLDRLLTGGAAPRLLELVRTILYDIGPHVKGHAAELEEQLLRVLPDAPDRAE